ncbi:flagellar basal-body rod protein FlgG [Candidatus Aerophobetes bacterium]|nr:flagellar basal-body rod protein FlgG [Candidatus Aerophobetes bacterium]
MLRALWTAATGMKAQQLFVDTIANNLANVNTSGFKKSRVDFQDLLYHTIKVAGTKAPGGGQIPVGIQIGHGVQSVSIERLFSQGEIIETQNPLDLVIEGDGFFQVLQADGTIAYTRDGSFKLDKEGRIVTASGLPLEPEITIPSEATNITISHDGTVSVLIPGTTAPQDVGTITLAKFINPGGLKSLGYNLYQATDASGDVINGTPGLEGFGTVAQGYLEMSNVQVVEEMANMIIAQRAYEINSKAIQMSDEMLRIANNLRR